MNGPFVIMTFDSPTDPPMVYLETAGQNCVEIATNLPGIVAPFVTPRPGRPEARSNFAGMGGLHPGDETREWR
jgi:hypothetical protein